MKRVTVAITLVDDYPYSGDLRKLKGTVVAAAVDKANELGLGIRAVEAKVANNVKKVPA